MKHDILATNNNDIENDERLWGVLGHAREHRASPRFVDDVCRAVRLLPERKPWWKSLLSPLPLAATAGAAAALVAIAVFVSPNPSSSVAISQPAQTIVSDEIQDLAETETLDAAIDHMDKFSDVELVSLCGF